MARTLVEAQLTTRNARSKLPEGLHWRGLDREVHLGYRKGKRGGVWLVRWRDGKGYRQTPLGTSDDVLTDGALDYDAAVREGKAVVAQSRKDAIAEAEGPALTVRSAVVDYIARRDARDTARAGRPVASDASQRMRRYITGREAAGARKAIAASPIADIALHRLTEADLAAWLAALPDGLKRTSQRRLVNDFKAALNLAYSMNRKRLDAELPATIKMGLQLAAIESGREEAVAREGQILSDGEVTRLLGAAREIDEAGNWDGDLFRLVLILAATGARFSQVARMRVADCQIDARRLLIPPSRKGRGTKPESIAVPVAAEVIDALLPVVVGRPGGAVLLERWRHKQAPGGIAWERDTRGPWLNPSELVRPWHLIRDRANLSEAVVPYALRHSGVVRKIRANVPLRLIAAEFDTSAQMIEKHYSRWISSGLEEISRAAIVPLLPASTSNVVPFGQSRAGSD